MPKQSNKRIRADPLATPAGVSRKVGKITAKEETKEQLSQKKVEKANGVGVWGSDLQKVDVDVTINGEDGIHTPAKDGQKTKSKEDSKGGPSDPVAETLN